MKNFQDKVAVVTGAGSGIGRALAVRSAQEGMRVVLADVEDEALAQTEAQIRSGLPPSQVCYLTIPAHLTR